ncbi:MAG: energy-coupling factor ABC transporter permease [Hydrogenophaga sp.]|jgi:uncharacterized membrane protein|uniref:energy-coupling factor ABC transporter permease n=1 Tax=Hydrogenophaga sp. TaxID=1904254 RepID=UPI000ED79BF2|nr:energy-coupling factor ABC transporter permease [Hydrogenophaga sp.]MDD3785681.1 energy-coupling factor ABC transporter permease [Hydrogenophaga sp.]MDX9968343.1 energy-coupling factor ABC transporter permease [Hydrogenophaga sp.]HAJ12574.1 hypothetical protein [Comamonadaceae bacterium]
MWFSLNLILALTALGVAAWLRPWRMLRGPLLTPALAAVVLLPWVWLLPQKMPQGLQVQLSGACLLVLMLGWPLAVLVLSVVSLLVWLVGQAGVGPVLQQGVWIGLVPATLALGVGAAVRRWLPANIFIYTLGRAFMGTALSMFVAGLLLEGLSSLSGQPPREQALVARWLMAWGDAFLTGMFAAIFVAFAPQWLATWSDRRYLK